MSGQQKIKNHTFFFSKQFRVSEFVNTAHKHAKKKSNLPEEIEFWDNAIKPLISSLV